MSAWNVTTGSNASTTFSNFEFDSFCVGVDGSVYAIKSDGLYKLEGNTDNGVAIDALVEFGRLDFGTSRLKHGYVAYIGGTAEYKLKLGVNDYEYEARSASANEAVARVDIGKGLRVNYFELSLSNQNGASFAVDSIEFGPATTGRKI